MSNPNFDPKYSSNEVYRNQNLEECLTDWMDSVDENFNNLPNNYAPTNHNHDLNYAPVNHTHTGYAETTHNHDSAYSPLSHSSDQGIHVTETEKNTWNGKADLVNGKVPISQIPDEVKEIRIASNIAARNALTGLFAGLSVYVVDATSDSTVNSGGAFYMYDGTGWIKTGEAESMDVVLQWANVIGKPESLPANGGNADTLDGKHASDFALANAIEITQTGEDLNNYQTAGIYVFAQAYAPLNVPAGTNGWLIVLPWQLNSNTVKQIWLRHGTVGSTDFEIYVRTKIGSENVWGSWSKLYTTSNPPTAAEVGASPKFTNDTGGVEYSYGANSGKNVVVQIGSWPQGFHTGYAIAGTSGNPNSSEAFRFLVHKTSASIGWIIAFGSSGSIYTNYQNGEGVYKGWKALFEANPGALWTGSKYMHDTQTISPTKNLDSCRNGWMLEWSDYDKDGSSGTTNNFNFVHTPIYKKRMGSGNWNGENMMFAIPSYCSTDGTTRTISIKQLKVFNDHLTGHESNDQGTANQDVVLRAVYEF